MNAKKLSALLESKLKERLEKEKFTTPDQMRMHKEAKTSGYSVIYRDKAFDKTYTAQIPPGISKAEIVKMLKRTIRVGLEVISIQPMKESVKEASDVWKIFDLKQKLYGQAMDMEDDLKSIAMELKQKRADMEQEAEPGGGKIADRYGKELRKLEKDYNKKRHELKKVRDKIEKLDNKYVL